MSPIRWVAPSSWKPGRRRSRAAPACSSPGSIRSAERDLEEGRRFVIGVNAFREEEETTSPPLLTVNPRIEEEQVERLRTFRAARDRQSCEESLERLKCAAREDANLLPTILSAVQSSATLGEIIGALKTVWGEYRPGA